MRISDATVARHCSVLLALLLGTVLVRADGKPWMTKPYEAWTEKDIQCIMTQSPWVQVTTIRRTWLPIAEKDVPPQPLISGGIRKWPADAPNLTGVSPAVAMRASESSQSELKVYFYWDSSRVMRAASARQRVLRDEIEESEVDAYVRAPLEEYALVLSMADMTPFLQNDKEFFQKEALLLMRGRERQTFPSHVVYQRDPKGTLKQAVFFFPKMTPSGEPTIANDETDLEFRIKIADSIVHVGFKPKQMVDQVGPDL
jgi:hypothetical protein